MTQTSRIACDMRTAPDNPEERAAEYQHLFATALCGRDQTAQSVTFRFRADPEVDAQVRSLAAREQTCCPFFHINITTIDDQQWWETRVDDTAQAKAILEEFGKLPDQPLTTARSMINRRLVTVAPPPVGTSRPAEGHDQQRRRALRTLLTAIAALMLLLSVGPRAHAEVVPDDYYQVVNHQTGECLDVWGASTAHAANVGVWRCVGADNQQWRLEPLGNDWYQIRVLHTDMCLDVAYRSRENDADVIQGTCADPNLSTSYNQHWRRAPLGGYDQLVNRNSGKCLDKALSGDVVQYTCGDWRVWWQQWSFR